ncbi:MAG: hypothetical protein RIS64_4514 [Bacteroidota bacterium]
MVLRWSFIKAIFVWIGLLIGLTRWQMRLVRLLRFGFMRNTFLLNRIICNKKLALLQIMLIFVKKYQKLKLFAMIIDFSVTNFRSFKKPMLFSFRADASKNHTENVFEVTLSGGETCRLLKTAVIYGANASGKSNVVKAFQDFRDFIEQSPELKYGDAIKWYEPFLLDVANQTMPSTFKINFILNNLIQYEYEVQFNNECVLLERLDFYPQGNKNLLFERQNNDIKFGRRFKRQNISKKIVPNRLYLSEYGNDGHEQLGAIYLYFRNFMEVGTVLNRQLLASWDAQVKQKAYKDKGYETGKKLKVYFHAPIKDIGWNLENLVTWYDLQDTVILNKDIPIGGGVPEVVLNKFVNSWLDLTMSFALNNAPTTAMAFAPAAITCAALSKLMPPIATSGIEIFCFASANKASGACIASGLVCEPKHAPKAT